MPLKENIAFYAVRILNYYILVASGSISELSVKRWKFKDTIINSAPNADILKNMKIDFS